MIANHRHKPYARTVGSKTEMNHVKRNLTNYIPELTKFIGDEKFPWDEIENKYNSRNENLFNNKHVDSILLEASIFDQIISLKKGNSAFEGMVDYYNKLFYQLNLLLNLEEKILVFKIIKNLLISFDSKYLNYLGELSVLYRLKNTGNFTIIEIEKTLPNGKSIDFDLMILNPKMRVLLEVTNIHLNPKKVEQDKKKIGVFIDGRLNRKMKDKKKNLIEEWNIHLIPVIWGEFKHIEIYHKYYKANSTDVPLSYEPLAFLTLFDKKGNYFPKFGSVKTLFE